MEDEFEERTQNYHITISENIVKHIKQLARDVGILYHHGENAEDIFITYMSHNITRESLTVDIQKDLSENLPKFYEFVYQDNKDYNCHSLSYSKYFKYIDDKYNALITLLGCEFDDTGCDFYTKCYFTYVYLRAKIDVEDSEILVKPAVNYF